MAWRTVSGEAAPVTVTVETPPDCRSMWTSLTWRTACTASVALCAQGLSASWVAAEGLVVSPVAAGAPSGAGEVVADGVADARSPPAVETGGRRGGSRSGHRNSPSRQWDLVVSPPPSYTPRGY